jgi:hypothetical protein
MLGDRRQHLDDLCIMIGVVYEVYLLYGPLNTSLNATQNFKFSKKVL